MAQLLNTHPGEEIKKRLRKLHISQQQLAHDIKESPVTIDRIIKRKSALTAAIAIKVAKALSFDAEFLMELQARHDVSRALRHETAERINPYPVPDEKDENRSK